MEKSENYKARKSKLAQKKLLLWEDMNFGAAEAYNLLRSNLVLSFPEEDGGARVIGLTSTAHAEGKSLTALNLAAALAKGSHKTLLLECDLRIPAIGSYLGILKSAGISEFLTGMAEFQDVVHEHVGYDNLDVVLCGKIPPNPSELLGSKRMAGTLEELKEGYEYIILDFPPLGAVADAMVLLQHIDGMIVVVRNNVTEKKELAETMRQLQNNHAKILGFVYNGIDSTQGKYYKKYYKSQYYSHR